MNEFKIKSLIYQLEQATKEMKDQKYLDLTLLQINGLRMVLELNQDNE